jgi:probable F420-dependent oxidoreductase
MRIGVRLPHFGNIAADPLKAAEQIEAVARAADDIGFHSIWVGDHVTPGIASAERFGSTWYDGLTTLAFAAGVTRRVRLGTAVLIAPYRQPLLVAKALATLDCLSGGRVDAGFGTGWMEAEFDALGLSTFADRGRVTDEVLGEVKAIWSGAGISVAATDRPYTPLPAPANPHGIPVWIGGNSARAARRVARFGDGWMLLRTGPEQVRACLADLDSALAAAQRERSSVHIGVETALRFLPDSVDGQPFLGPPQQVVESLGELTSQGVDHVLFDMFYNAPGMEEVAIEEMLEGMAQLGEIAASALP